MASYLADQADHDRADLSAAQAALFPSEVQAALFPSEVQAALFLAGGPVGLAEWRQK